MDSDNTNNSGLGAMPGAMDAANPSLNTPDLTTTPAGVTGSAMPQMQAAPVAPAPEPISAMPAFQNQATASAPEQPLPVAPTMPDLSGPAAPQPAPVTEQPLPPAPTLNPVTNPTVTPAPVTPMPGTAPSSSSTVADFTNDPSVQSAPETPKDETPIQPAAPVPGSIGSVTSWADIQAEEAKKAAAQSNPAGAKKPMNKRLMIIIIALVAVAVAGVVIFLVMSMNTGKKTTTSNTTTYVPPEPVATTVSCTRAYTPDETAAAGVTSGTTKIAGDYEDDFITKYTEETVLTTNTEEEASAVFNSVQDSYNNSLVERGLVDGNGAPADPAVSTYAIDGTTVNVAHTVDPATLNETTASIYGFSLESDGTYNLDSAEMESVLTANGYTCEVIEN